MLSQTLFNNPTKLQRCTGLTVEQFNELAGRIEPLWSEAEEKRLSRPDRKRAIGAGHPYRLKTIQEKLCCVLMWYKIYSAFWFLGMIVGLDAGQVCRLLQKIRPLIEKAADPQLKNYFKKVNKSIQKSRKKISSWEELKREFPEVAEILIDATEQQRQRPKKRVQKKFFSGKKKRHTLKTQITTSLKGKILNVSKSHPGSIHDYEIFKKEKTAKNIPKKSKSYLDKGYQGIKKDHPEHETLTPIKKNRWKKKLSRSEKRYNKKLARKRISVEHTFSRLKKYRVLSEVFRHQIEHYNQDFRNVAALVNFRLVLKT